MINIEICSQHLKCHVDNLEIIILIYFLFFIHSLKVFYSLIVILKEVTGSVGVLEYQRLCLSEIQLFIF